MRHRIIYFVMMVLALAACKEDDLQQVSFDSELISVGAEAQTINVQVTANCPWYITTQSERAHATSTYGEGSSMVNIILFKNAEYEYCEHIFQLTSEDGTSKASLVVRQEPRIKMDISMEGNIPAEGGYYNIYMDTNDDVQCTEYPDWITHIVSRAIDRRTYTLECTSNRTGSPRVGTIIFTGRDDEYVVNVKQDSFTPEKVSMTIPEMLMEGLKTYKFTMDVVPVYADWSKLDISLTNDGKVWTEGEYILFEFPRYGSYTLTVYSNEKLIHKQVIQVCPVDPVLYIEDGSDVCLGDFIHFTDENCSMEFSNRNLVQQQKDGSYRMVREGDLKVTAVNRYSGERKSADIRISRVVMNIESVRVTATGDKNRVQFLFSARGCDMKSYRFYLVNKLYPSVKLEELEGVVSESGMQTIYYSPATELVEATIEDPVQYLKNRYTLHFVADINGENHHVIKNFQ